jgi:hypothetical protein
VQADLGIAIFGRSSVLGGLPSLPETSIVIYIRKSRSEPLAQHLPIAILGYEGWRWVVGIGAIGAVFIWFIRIGFA